MATINFSIEDINAFLTLVSELNYSSAQINTNLGKAAACAPLKSPTFTGTPKAPAISDLTTNSTRIATTAFVHSVVSQKVTAAIEEALGGIVSTLSGIVGDGT